MEIQNRTSLKRQIKRNAATFTIQIHQTNRNQFSSPYNLLHSFFRAIWFAPEPPLTSNRSNLYAFKSFICGRGPDPERNWLWPTTTTTMMMSVTRIDLKQYLIHLHSGLFFLSYSSVGLYAAVAIAGSISTRSRRRRHQIFKWKLFPVNKHRAIESVGGDEAPHFHTFCPLATTTTSKRLQPTMRMPAAVIEIFLLPVISVPSWKW